MINHPLVGRSLRDHLIVAHCSGRLAAAGFSQQERFWSEYYWLARFAKEWQAIHGFNAGLEQQVFQCLELAIVDFSSLAEVDEAVERDAFMAGHR